MSNEVKSELIRRLKRYEQRARTEHKFHLKHQYRGKADAVRGVLALINKLNRSA